MPDVKASVAIVGENQVAAAFRGAVRDAQSAADRMSSLFKTAFAGISVAAIAGLVKQTINLGEQIGLAAQKAGLGTKDFSELAYAAKRDNIEIEALSKAFKAMQVSLSNASQGGKDQTLTLHALGLEFKDLQGLKPDQQFELLAQRISELKDPADRTRASVELFGKAGADLLPMFEKGAAGIRKAREEAKQLGQSFDETTINHLREAEEAGKKLEASWGAFAVTMTAKVSPAIASVLDKLRIMAGGASQIESLKGQIEDLEQTGARLANWDPQGFARILKQISAAKQQLFELEQARLTAEHPDRRSMPGAQEQKAPGFAAASAAENAAKEAKKWNDWFTKQRHDTEDKFDAAYIEKSVDTEAAAAERKNDVYFQAMKERRDGELAAEKYQTEQLRNFYEQVFEDVRMSGTYSFKQLGKAILAELANRQILKAIDTISTALAHVGGGKSGGGGGFWNSLGSLFASVIGGGSSGGGGGSGGSGGVPAYATGGSFTVGGRGGTDANLVAFRATRGERVSISPDGGGGAVHITNNVTQREGENGLALAERVSDITIARMRDLKRRGRF